MEIVAIALVLLYAAPVIRSYWRQHQARLGGTETDAYVSWIEKNERTAYGGTVVWRYCYVRFLKENGQEAEARLFNPSKKLLAGSRVRIRYLPERDNYAVLTAVTEE